MYEFNGLGENGENIVITFEKQDEKVTLKFYLKELAGPNFEENYGFSDKFTNRNLSIITSDSKDVLKLRLSGDTEIELGLNPLKIEIGNFYPWEGTIKFNMWFWKSYKYFIEKEFAELAEKG